MIETKQGFTRVRSLFHRLSKKYQTCIKSDKCRSLLLLFSSNVKFEYSPTDSRQQIDFSKDEWTLEVVESYSQYIHDDLVSVRQNYAESCKRLEQITAIDGILLTILATMAAFSNLLYLLSFILITLSAVFSTICVIKPVSVEDSYTTPDSYISRVADTKIDFLMEMINTDIRLICANSAANRYKRDIQRISGTFLLLGIMTLLFSVCYVYIS